jgi:hypothetical protein
MQTCDRCGLEQESLHMTSINLDLCDECLEDADPNVRAIDPDEEYDRRRDEEMMMAINDKQRPGENYE